MTAVDLETYEGQVARLEQDYIRDLGRSIDEALSVGGPFDLPIGTSYQPGNGTVYRLVFTPVEVIVQLDEPVPVGVPREESGRRWVLLSKCNCTDSDFCHPST